MDPVGSLSDIRPGMWSWQGYEPDVRCDLTATAVETDAGLILIDPIPLNPAALEALIAPRNAVTIALTNGNHQRESLAIQQQYGIPIVAPAAARGKLIADLWIEPGEGTCALGMTLLDLPGGAAGESAYWIDGPQPTLIFGDAMVHLPPEGLRPLPDKYCSNPKLLAASLRILTTRAPETLCFAHGAPISENAAARLLAALG